MKTVLALFVSGLLIAPTLMAAENNTTATDTHKAHHVVVIWLKQHGDAHARRQYIDSSKKMAKHPGVLSYNIGTPADLHRQQPNAGLDETYDLAITSTFTNRQALEDYSKNPHQRQIIQDELKPLVERYVVYDFVE